MKALSILPLIIFIQVVNANELEWVDKQIKAIQPSRQGMKNIGQLKDPFVFLNKEDKKSKEDNKIVPSPNITFIHSNKTKQKVHIVKKSRFNLSMIINKSAKINNKWYKQGDILHGHKIFAITPNSVILLKNKKQTILSIYSKNKNIKFKHQ